MEEQVQPVEAESAEATPEVIGEQVESETTEQVEESEPTSPEEKTVPLKAVLEERRKKQEFQEEAKWLRQVAMGEVENPFQKTDSELVKPTPDQFDDYDKYVEALADFKAEQVFLKRQKETQKLTKEQFIQREEARLQAKAAADAQEAAKRHPDFYEVAGKVTLPGEALKAMYQSDLGPEIAYYLGKNSNELERIKELSPSRQIMELGKIEVKLAAKTAQPEKKEQKKPTEVETAGRGFTPPKTNLQQLRTDAMKTGDWTKYLEAAGFVP